MLTGYNGNITSCVETTKARSALVEQMLEVRCDYRDEDAFQAEQGN